MSRNGRKTTTLVAGVLALALSAHPAPSADDGSWAFPVGAAESGSGWYVTIGLGGSWTSSSGTSYRGHLAEDWFRSSGSSLGEPVYAAAAGRVVVLRQNCGNYVDIVVIEHVIGGELVYSLYGHVEADGYVTEGQQVQKRQQVGVIGDPVVFNPHLHFSILNRTAFLRGPHSNCSDSANGRYVASGYSGISNDYDGSLDYYDPSNDGIAGNWFYHPSRFVRSRLVARPSGTNVARTAINWLASSSYNGSFGGDKAFDGVASSGSKWTSNGASIQSWLALDLGASYELTGFVVRHAGSGGEPRYLNTRAYRMEQGSSLTGPWTVLASVDNQSQLDATTTILGTPTAARYVRLFITNPGVDTYARIPELEVYGAPAASNVARSAVSWSASSSYNALFDGRKAIDGVVSASSKWTSNGSSPESWLALDLGAFYDLSRFVVRHAGAGGEPAYYNTRAFRLEQGASLSGPWSTLASIDNSSQQSVTTATLPSPVTARYVRLYVSSAGIDSYARIPELEVYGVVARNLSRNAAAWSASSSYSAAFSGSKALDGATSSKWTSNGGSAQSWLALDLGAPSRIDSIIVRHAGAGGEPAYYNTRSYRIEVGPSLGGPWTAVASVDNSSQLNVTSTTPASPWVARFVRLYVLDAGVDSYARIPELEVLGAR